MPDGKRVISCSGDKTIRIWDTTFIEANDAPYEGHTD